MPLVAATAIAYAAGLLCGFDVAAFWTGSAAVLIVWRAARHTRERLALGAIAVGGFAVASDTRLAEATCLRQASTRTAWEVKLSTDAEPGAFVRARHACGFIVRIAVRQGRANAGARVRVRGQVTFARAGLLVSDATVQQLKPPSALANWRALIGRGIDRHFGPDAGLVRALLIADVQDLSPMLRDRFAAAGLVHMLSVSGLHVGLIAVAVSLLGQVLGVPKSRGDALVVAITALYVTVIGAPLPAVRAAAMLGVSALGVAVQRFTSPWAGLAVGAGLPLLDPRSILDLGYQLSVAGMVALVAAGGLGQHWSWLKQGGWRGSLYRSLVASTTATVLTAPLIATTFGRVSLVAPITNLAGAPVMAVLQPMLFLAALCIPIAPAAQFVADACRPLLLLLDWIATAGARLPGASILMLVDHLTAVLAYVAAGAFVVAAMSRFPGRALVAGAACVAAIVVRPLVPMPLGLTEIHVIDVGQGDAIALRTTRGRWVLFDAGRDWQGGDEGKRSIIPYLSRRGGELVAFVLSHPHSDHVGGAASTLSTLRPQWYFDPGFAGTTSPYRASLLAVQNSATRWRRVRPGDSLVVDDATITFLAPDSTWAESQDDPNLASTVARIRVGAVTMLLTGDAEAGEEEWLLAHQRQLLDVDVLKVGHHGSNTSSTSAFLDAVSPRLALISVGAGNMYRHPSAAVMQSLAAHGAVTLRTDLLGSIVVRTDGRRIEVEAGGERWPLAR